MSLSIGTVVDTITPCVPCVVVRHTCEQCEVWCDVVPCHIRYGVISSTCAAPWQFAVQFDEPWTCDACGHMDARVSRVDELNMKCLDVVTVLGRLAKG